MRTQQSPLNQPREPNPPSPLHAVVDGHVERYHPKLSDPLIHYHHLHRYAFARAFADGLDVLDVACGEGYGSAMLAEVAREVTGVDINEPVIHAATLKYGNGNLRFIAADALVLPFEDESFDLVVCFEALEHISEQEAFVREIHRVLSPDGLVLISTPKKSSKRARSENPFHVKELSKNAFIELLEQHFENRQLLSQTISLVSAMRQLSPSAPAVVEERVLTEEEGGYVLGEAEPESVEMFVAVASNVALPVLANSYLVDIAERGRRSTEHLQEELEYYRAASSAAVEIIRAKGDLSSRKATQLRALEQQHAAALARLGELGRATRALAMQPLSKPRQDSATNTKVSVIIPVLNGGARFVTLLESIRRQQHVGEVEILVADSGSSDGSLEAARRHGARVIEIPPSEFSHGGTRDMVGRMATGELLLFTVQDAVPSRDSWLADLVGLLDANSDVAILSARQIATDDADLYSRLHLSTLYPTMHLTEDLKYRVGSPATFEAIDTHHRRVLSFVDNVCSIMRSDVFGRFGFRPIRNAEDIELGVRMAKSGMTLGFAASAPVLHWHSREPAYFLRRAYLGVEAAVDLLGHTLQPLPPAAEDPRHMLLAIRSAYETVRLSLALWCNTEPLLRVGVAGYVRAFGLATETLDERGAAARSREGRSKSLEAMLRQLSIELGIDVVGEHLTGDNPVIARFAGHLKQSLPFFARDKQLPTRQPEAFKEVTYKHLAVALGDYLGHWMQTARAINPGARLDAVDTLLSRGVCKS